MITVFWQAPLASDIVLVRIKRAVAKAADYFQVAEIDAYDSGGNPVVTYQDADGQEGQWYSIAFVNTIGNESIESDPVIGQINGYTSYITQYGNKNIQNFDSNDDNLFPQYPYRGYHRYTPEDYLLHGNASPYSKTPTAKGLQFYDRLAQREDALIRATGEWATLYRRKWDGAVCDCYDTRRGQAKHRCKICYGTGYIGGYVKFFNPFSDPAYAQRYGGQLIYSDRANIERIGITVNWNPPKAADITQIKIKRSLDPNGTFTTLETFAALDGYGEWVTSYYDDNGSRAHWYRVSFINDIGQESPDSDLIQSVVVADLEAGQSTEEDKILIRVGPTQDDMTLKNIGQMQEMIPGCWTLPSPALRDRDMIIRYDESGAETWRFEVLNVTRNVGLFQGNDNTNYGAQVFTLRRLEKTDPLYWVHKDTPGHPVTYSEAYGDGYGDGYGGSGDLEYELYYDMGYVQGSQDQSTNSGYDPEKDSPLITRISAYSGWKQGYNAGYRAYLG